MAHFQWEQQELILHCHIQPKSSNDEIVGVYNDRLKIKITAPPADGKANQHLVKFLAKSFGVSKSSVTLLRGQTSREKSLGIHNPARIPESAQVDAPL